MEALMAVDGNGVIRMWSGDATELFDYDAKEVVGKSLLTVMPSLSPEFAVFDKGIAERNVRTDACRKSGETVPVTAVLNRVEMAGSHWTIIRMALSNGRDLAEPSVTDRPEVSDALAAIEAFSVYETGLPTPCFAVSADTTILGWSDKCTDFFGVSRNFSLGRRLAEAIEQLKPAEQIEHDITAAIAGVPTEQRAVEFFDSAGSSRDLLFNVFPLRFTGGKVVGAVIAVEDVTIRRDAEQIISEAAVLYREIFMKTPLMKMLFDFETLQILDANPAACDFYHYSLAELSRMKVPDLSREPATEVEHLKSGVYGYESQPSYVTRHQLRTGEMRDVEVHPTFIEVQGRQLVHTVIINVTDAKRDHLALRDSEEKLRTLVSNAPVILFAFDRNGIFTMSEGMGLERIGQAPNEGIGRSIFDIYADHPDVLAAVNRALTGHAAHERLVLRGNRFEVSYKPITNANGAVTGVIGVAMDITDLVEAEDALRRSNSILMAQLEASLDGVVVVDEAEQFAVYNKRLADMWHVPEEWLTMGDRPRVLDKLVEQVTEPDAFTEELKHFYANPAASGRADVKLRDGRMFERYTAPVVSRSGEWYGRIWYYRDITMQKQAEAELKQSRSELEARVRERTAELAEARDALKLAYDDTILGWSHALDLRDRETEGHSQRVTALCLRISEVLGVSAADRDHIRRGALLHDIGKMGIPDAILQKPGPLTDDEWVIMRKHPVYAHDMLQRIDFLRPALEIPYSHHERWDGTGYPLGLSGTDIPLAARIFAVADVWDALRSNRPYRDAWPTDRVREHIRAGSGTHFDPTIIEAFENLLDTEPLP